MYPRPGLANLDMGGGTSLHATPANFVTVGNRETNSPATLANPTPLATVENIGGPNLRAQNAHATSQWLTDGRLMLDSANPPRGMLDVMLDAMLDAMLADLQTVAERNPHRVGTIMRRPLTEMPVLIAVLHVRG
jgi:hypothetical protein